VQLTFEFGNPALQCRGVAKDITAVAVPRIGERKVFFALAERATSVDVHFVGGTSNTLDGTRVVATQV
jgi:hypothetical protein